MKLGVFDSGLGGLIINKAIRGAMPDLDMVYLGDTLHLPYGNRSEEAIYKYTKACMDALFHRQCSLIVMACNTASAAALRRLQQTWLPYEWPGRNIIGVVVPTLETALERGYKNLGLIGTNYIVRSGVYEEELRKLDDGIRLNAQATPLLVPLIENDGGAWLPSVLDHYLEPLLARNIECLILGCTHYAFMKDHLRNLLHSKKIDLISQDEIIPKKLADYLDRHPEYTSPIGRNGQSEFLVTDLTDNYLKAAQTLYGAPLDVEKVTL